MARTINEIQQTIILDLQSKFLRLSTSKVAEWRLWAYVVAAAIQAFEVLLDLFRGEVDELTSKMTAGTVSWYEQMCYRFQNGHKLVYDKRQGVYYYEKDDPQSRIVKVAAITEGEKRLSIRVAKSNDEGKLIPLLEGEKTNIEDYFATIHTAGIPVTIISTTADMIRYNLDIYYNPVIPASVVRENVLQALDTFKTSLSFDAMFYRQQIVDAAMHAEGVVTVNAQDIGHKRSVDAEFSTVDVSVELTAGYFEYTDENTLNLISVKSL